jgi:hypothetical protein
MTYIRVKKFFNGQPIVFGRNRYQAPFSVQLTNADLQNDGNGNYVLPEGMFVANVGSGVNTKVRFLPRTDLRNATATNSATITLKSPNAQFLAGDVLFPQASYGYLEFGGTFVQNDVHTIIISDELDAESNYAVTVSATTTAVATAAGWITANSAALATAGVVATQVAGTGRVELYGSNSFKVITYTSNPATTIVFKSDDAPYLGTHPVALGTILSITNPPLTNGDRTVTLAGNAAYVVPAGVSVGVKVTKHLGIVEEPTDLTYDIAKHLAPLTGCDGVYESRLPYCDKQLKRVHKDLNINKVFYNNKA